MGGGRKDVIWLLQHDFEIVEESLEGGSWRDISCVFWMGKVCELRWGGGWVTGNR